MVLVLQYGLKPCSESNNQEVSVCAPRIATHFLGGTSSPKSCLGGNMPREHAYTMAQRLPKGGNADIE